MDQVPDIILAMVYDLAAHGRSHYPYPLTSQAQRCFTPFCFHALHEHSGQPFRPHSHSFELR